MELRARAKKLKLDTGGRSEIEKEQADEELGIKSTEKPKKNEEELEDENSITGSSSS